MQIKSCETCHIPIKIAAKGNENVPRLERPQNLFLTAQSTQIKSVISVPIKDFIHHYPRALINDIPRVGAYFYDIPGSGRTLTTYPGQLRDLSYEQCLTSATFTLIS